MQKLRSRLNYANVMVTILAFIVLGGSAIAAGHLGKNSVGTKQLKKNAVTGAKVKNHSLTGKDIKLSKLGTVPSATHATSADSANSIPAAEATHLVGAAGEPPFKGGSSNVPPEGPFAFQEVGFYKDHEGIVHLEGIAKVGAGSIIFNLPPGYRPATNRLQAFQPGEQTVLILGGGINGGPVVEGDVAGPTGETVVLSGISFRAGS
jgi:hypothetical protein